MQNAASSTHASARRAVERGLCNSKRIETISVAVAADGSRHAGRNSPKIEDRYPRARRGAVTAR
jgi:hypothetical protein